MPTTGPPGTDVGVPSRRNLLRGGLWAAGGAVAATAAGTSTAGGPAHPPRTHPFRGSRQPGVVTPPQGFAAWVGLDLVEGADRDVCRRLLRVLTDDIERLMRAEPPVTDQEPELARVVSGLTVTVGVGPGFYDAADLDGDRPSWLVPLPDFGIDRLDPAWGQTDVVLQVCADSPVSVSHTTRRLVVGVHTLATQTWVQRGFREPLTRDRPGLPFRNLFGQIDGTVQPALDGSADEVVWIGPHGPRGLTGGTSLVLRRIEMDMDGWDRTDRVAREHSVGRTLDTGAPLTGRKESDPPDLTATNTLGFAVIDPVSHMRRAMPVQAHEKILRRPYSYDDAPTMRGVSNTGLVFASFQADPVRQFLPIQQRLAQADLLNQWTTPVGSAVYAVLPGAREGEPLGAVLLG